MTMRITTADLTPEGIRALSRRKVTDVPQRPVSGEDAWTTQTRDLAHYLTEISGSLRWDAVMVQPAYPVRYLPREMDQVITLDDRFLIVARMFEPVGSIARHSITVNGRSIAHRQLTPGHHGINEVVHSVWHHLNLINNATCDHRGCTAMPVFALAAGGGFCAQHIDRHAR